MMRRGRGSAAARERGSRRQGVLGDAGGWTEKLLGWRLEHGRLNPDTLSGSVNLEYIKSCHCRLDSREPAVAAVCMEKSEI